MAEGKMLAKLDHPNLARIFDLDFHEDRPFLAMEYIRGMHLRAYAENHSLTPRKSASNCGEDGPGRGRRAQASIVHMDIKPQNILMDEKDDRG